ncbi:MAG: GvpL/GvpF family gas vesicle protein [Nanoarchaeota archaeon]|nr:GvpL/GvpF family gas vesicle protein [Nanoarchaeota archaeon]
MAKKNKIGEYLYCITTKKDAPKEFNIKGMEDSDIRVMFYRDLAAIVSKAPLKEYEPTEENVEKHKTVALHILKDHTVLPVALGMVFKKMGILTSTMGRVYFVLKKSLNLIDNKIELGVKVILPKNFEESNNGKSIEELREECKTEFAKKLDGIAVESKEGKLFSDRLALNMSFLVDRNNIDKFSDILGKLDDKYNDLKVQYTGPWPPYNFVDVRIMSRGK